MSKNLCSKYRDPFLKLHDYFLAKYGLSRVFDVFIIRFSDFYSELSEIWPKINAFSLITHISTPILSSLSQGYLLG